MYKHGHSPSWPIRHRKFDIAQNTLMKLVREAMTLVPCKETQGGVLLHIFWLYTVKVYQIQEVNKAWAVDKQCWADNIVFTLLLTAILFLVYRSLWFCTSKNIPKLLNQWRSHQTLSKGAEEYMSLLPKIELILPFLNNYHYLNFCFTKATQIKNAKKAYPINTRAFPLRLPLPHTTASAHKLNTHRLPSGCPPAKCLLGTVPSLGQSLIHQCLGMLLSITESTSRDVTSMSTLPIFKRVSLGT